MTVQRDDETRHEQPDLVVAWLAYLLSEAQAAVSWIAYTRLARLWNRRGLPEPYFNYAYAMGWIAMLATLFALAVAAPKYAAFFALIASYRYLEVAVWYLRLLFDSQHRLMISPERNLLFLTIDSAATVVVIGFWLAAVPGPGSSAMSEWSAALSTFTLNGGSAGFEGWQADLATILGTLGGLLLIGAGLAILVGLISERFELGPVETYTGTYRLPRPSPRPRSRPGSHRDQGGRER